MLYYSLTGLINAVASTVLGFFVYTTDRKSEVNRRFALFCLSVAFWSWAYIFWPQSQDKEMALRSFQFLHLGSMFIPVTYFHFVLTFLGKGNKKKMLLKFCYLLALFFASFVFTPFFIKDMVPKFSFPFWAVPGPLYHFYLLMFFALAVYSWILLAKASSQAENEREKQIQLNYILIGTLFGFLGGSTNYFLWYDINIPPVGNGLVLLYIILTTLAVIRYHLFNIKVVLSQALVGVIGLLLLIQFFLSQSLIEYIWRGILFLLFMIFGALLVRSVLQEIKYREQLQQAYQELQKLDEAKSEFLSIASHQLRTPLTAIKGYISLFLDGSYGKLDGKSRPPMEKISKSSEKLISLINDLLNVSRIEAGKIELKFETASVEEAIDLVVDELKQQIEKKGLTLKREKQQGLNRILMDKDKIRQVLMNVIDNAIKYTPQGSITIKTRNSGSGVIIQVRDTGLGMEKEELVKIFKSFSRGSAGNNLAADGTGLGLYIAKRFVEIHKGKIWAESEGRSKGSTIFIELPQGSIDRTS
jgi:signal transduction histidine kinase